MLRGPQNNVSESESAHCVCGAWVSFLYLLNIVGLSAVYVASSIFVPTLLKSGRHGVIPSALNTLLMASKPRASGGHAPGTRTRATGYKGKSGWSEYNRKLVAASSVTVHDVATKRLQVSTKQNQ